MRHDFCVSEDEPRQWSLISLMIRKCSDILSIGDSDKNNSGSGNSNSDGDSDSDSNYNCHISCYQNVKQTCILSLLTQRLVLYSKFESL